MLRALLLLTGDCIASCCACLGSEELLIVAYQYNFTAMWALFILCCGSEMYAACTRTRYVYTTRYVVVHTYVPGNWNYITLLLLYYI